MKTIRNSLFISLLVLVVAGCVERFFIYEAAVVTPKIVIDGCITDECHAQKIVISQSSPNNWPYFLPYSACKVRVADAGNHVFEFIEDIENEGCYLCTIDEQYLTVGNKFKLWVETPEGSIYESSFEELLPCPEIDSVYYQIEKMPTADPDKFIDGLQFYIDFSASDFFGHYYRWILEETYEYHSFWPIKDYIDVDGTYIRGHIDYSKFICYKTDTLNEIATLSTQALTKNSFKGAKLTFVDDRSQRLMYNYRLLVKQLSLNENSYTYWEKLKKNNKTGGGLFTKQPDIIVGNITNTGDSSETVLGYFGVSSVTTKAILVNEVKEFSFLDIPRCSPTFARYNLTPLEPRPLYFMYAIDPADGSWQLAWSGPECFDCTLKGGVVEKPYFFE